MSYELGNVLLVSGQLQEAIWKPPFSRTPTTTPVGSRPCGRESLLADADRELERYRELKAKSRERTEPPPVERP